VLTDIHALADFSVCVSNINSGHQRDGNIFAIMVDNQVLRNKLRPGRALWGCLTIVVLCMSIKDRSLTALLSC